MKTNRPYDWQIIYKNINSTSLFFLFLLGLTQFISGFMLSNDLAIKNSWLINRLTDIPFLLCSLLYFSTFIRLQMLKTNPLTRLQLIDLILISTTLVVVIFAQAYDLIIPNTLPS